MLDFQITEQQIEKLQAAAKLLTAEIKAAVKAADTRNEDENDCPVYVALINSRQVINEKIIELHEKLAAQLSSKKTWSIGNAD